MSTCDTFQLEVGTPENDWGIVAFLNWVVGRTIDEDLKAFIGNPVPGSVYTLHSGAMPPDVLVTTDGLLQGLIADIQGGTYNPVFKAVTPDGKISYSSVSIVLVSLAITAPTSDTPADVIVQQGSVFPPLSMADLLTYSGDPQGQQVVIWVTDGTSDSLPATVGLHTVGGDFHGAVDDAATLGDYNMVIKVVNQQGLFVLISFKITVIASVGTRPFVNFAYTGPRSCAVAGALAFWRDIGQPPDGQFIIDIDDPNVHRFDIIGGFVSNNGGTPITDFRIKAGDVLPTGFSIVTDDADPDFGFLIGTENETVANNQAVSFEVFNTAGWSDASPPLTFVFTEDAVVAPMILGVDGIAGTNRVFVRLSTEGETDNSPNQAASYELDMEFRVNNDIKAHTFIGGAGTRSLEFELDLNGGVLSGGQTLDFTFTD